MDNRVFEERYRLPDSLRYGIQAHTFSFFRNLEYFTPAADGKTLFGQQIALRGVLHPSPALTLSGGIYLWQDFGNPTLRAVRPIYTVRYQKQYFSFVFGTLEGQLAHRQIEPLQDFESVITRRQEEGLQLLYDGPRLWADAWLDWQNMIYRYSPQQERLQGGLSLHYALQQTDNNRLSLLAQGRAFHQGGQLDTAINKAPGTTFLAGASGLRYEAGLGNPHSFMVDVYGVRTHGVASLYPAAVRSGIGLYANAQWKNPWLTIMASYWQGNGVYVPGGGAMYSSLAQEVGASARGQVLKTRSLLILRLMRNYDLGSGCTLTLRAEPQYDFVLSQTDYNYQLFLNYMPRWGWR